MRRALFALLFLALPAPAWAAIAHVQTVCKDVTDGGNPQTTMAVTLTTTAGNLLIAVASASTGLANTATIASSPSETYSVAVSYVDVTAPSAVYQWYAANISSGSHTVTVTASAADYLTVCASEFSGVATSTPLDKTAGANYEGVTSSPTSTATATTSQADELLYGWHGGTYGGGQTWTAGTSFTIPSACNLRDSVCQYRIVSSTGAYTSQPSGTFSASFASELATYKAAAGGAAATRPRRAKGPF